MAGALVSAITRPRFPRSFRRGSARSLPIKDNRAGIDCALSYRLSNARLESTATKLKLLTRMAFGFHSHAPLVELAMLKLGGLCPPLPRLA
jgi:hypothetical protein